MKCSTCNHEADKGIENKYLVDNIVEGKFPFIKIEGTYSIILPLTNQRYSISLYLCPNCFTVRTDDASFEIDGIKMQADYEKKYLK